MVTSNVNTARVGRRVRLISSGLPLSAASKIDLCEIRPDAVRQHSGQATGDQRHS